MLLRKGRGRLIRAGIVGPDDPIRNKRSRIAAGWLLEGIFVLIFIGMPLLFGGWAPSNPHWMTNILASIMGVSVFLLPIDILGIEVDAVFEHGVSNSGASLYKTLTRRGFQFFDEITVIGITRDSKSGKEGLILFSGKDRKIRVRPFWDIYENGFNAYLKETLKARCPNAKWVYVPFTDALSMRFMTWKEARTAFKERKARMSST
jgi:hypothetical protein